MSTEVVTRAEAPAARARDLWNSRLAPGVRRLADAATLRAHGLAIRFDQVPEAFGVEEPVDETDATAVRREWLRQLRLWAGSSPEEVFAIKAGALMLGGVLALLLVVIAAI